MFSLRVVGTVVKQVGDSILPLLLTSSMSVVEKSWAFCFDERWLASKELMFGMGIIYYLVNGRCLFR